MNTRWSLVARAVDADTPHAEKALADFCKAYWYPLYAFARHSGKSPHDAEDLVQGFFTSLIEKNTLSAASREKGHLRTFLITCLKRYMNDERKRAHAEKRGSGKIVSLDLEYAEGRYSSEPVDDMTPDRIYQRRWALTILEQSLSILGKELEEKKRGHIFEALRPYLGFSATAITDNYATTAEALGLSVGTIKSTVSDLRQRFRAILFEQVALTLENDSEQAIKEELGELLGAL